MTIFGLFLEPTDNVEKNLRRLQFTYVSNPVATWK